MSGKSCLTNLLESLECWTKALDDGYGLDIIYLDYRKAFDSVLTVLKTDWEIENIRNNKVFAKMDWIVSYVQEDLFLCQLINLIDLKMIVGIRGTFSE